MKESGTYIKLWETILDSHLKGMANFITSQKETSLLYVQNFKNRSELGFNTFTLASDTYYRENYHSYILQAFLNPVSKHQEGHVFLHCFIDAINKCNKVPDIKLSDFDNAEVFREWYDIDILIKDDVSGKAIIIENKIYNAGDQQRQLPRYYHLMQKTHEVLAIVYLPLDISKTPSKRGWSKEDILAIDTLLCIIPSYHADSSVINLYNHWVKPCKNTSTIADNAFILKHYGELIKYLNTNTMDTVTLTKFYDSLLEDNNHETAISIRNMLNDLPEYLAIRIQNRYKDSFAPFKSLWRYKNRDVVFDGFEYLGGIYKIDVWCDESGYAVHFWETTNDDTDVKALFKTRLPQLDRFISHNQSTYNVKSLFSIQQEDEVFELIDSILNTLNEL